MLHELKEELEFAIHQLEAAANWAPTTCTAGVIRLQCEQARKVLAKADAAVAQDEAAKLMHRLTHPKV